jgi:putative transferase (TIGR04331 family)
VPTVIYWNAAHWELRDSAIPYFDELKRIGVFHETPESAANHIAKVWDNVEGWWNLKDVQEVLNSFKKNYCNVYPNLIQNLGKTLMEFYPSEKYD